MPTSLRMRVVIERFVDVPDGYLYSQTHGNGPDVVLLNAGYADLRMWDSTLAWLAEIARVTTLDYRDTGLSSRAAEPYSELDDLAAVLDAAGVESAVVVGGVSDGARRGLAFTRPITVLAGDRDFKTSELWGRRIVREAPDATLTVIPDADHYPMLSTPKEFERILRELLAN